MQNQSNTTSAWQQLVDQEISYSQALKLLVDEQATVNQGLLDIEVTNRFLRNFPDKSSLPSVIPLLLWRGFYYLGSPETLSDEEIAMLDERTCCEVQIIQELRSWWKRQPRSR